MRDCLLAATQRGGRCDAVLGRRRRRRRRHEGARPFPPPVHGRLCRIARSLAANTVPRQGHHTSPSLHLRLAARHGSFGLPGRL